MVHVLPLDDCSAHRLSVVCPCWPGVQFFDPADGREWVNGPVVSHNSFDSREEFEARGFPSGKKWQSLRLD